MLKYTTTQVTFREIPDEITLCINLSNCPIHCLDCHSKELWGDIGEELTEEKLCSLIEENKGITCVCFMGGNNDYWKVLSLAFYVEKINPNLATAWYSGDDILPKEGFDYIKICPYIKERGGLDNPNTNQRLYQKILCEVPINEYGDKYKFLAWKDITYKFWRHDTNIS